MFLEIEIITHLEMYIKEIDQCESNKAVRKQIYNIIMTFFIRKPDVILFFVSIRTNFTLLYSIYYININP